MKQIKTAWFGVALLASSWLFGLNYFYHKHPVIWVIMICLGSILLYGALDEMPIQRYAPIASILLLPAILFAQWPYKSIPILLISGAIILSLLPERKIPKRLASGFIAAGSILLAQAVFLEIYINITSRSHDLPYVFSKLLEGMASLLGIISAAHGSNLAMFSMRKLHNIGVTWELLFDPTTMAFIIGMILLIILKLSLQHCLRDNIKKVAKSLSALIIPILIWLPVRAGLMFSLYLHRVLHVEYEEPLHLISQFWNPWLHIILLIIPLLLVIRFINIPSLETTDIPFLKEKHKKRGQRDLRQKSDNNALLAAIFLFFFAILSLTLGLFLNPDGARKPGRILIDDFRSQIPWRGKEFDTTRTDKPFDTEWYGKGSGYNYYSIYEYCSHFYKMSRLYNPVTEEILQDTDVLFLKVPSGPFSDHEVNVIRKFVKNGGGLLLMGEHTNVFGSCVHLNKIAETFGFRFRYDCLFGIDSVFKEKYILPQFPHPIVRNIPYLDFAISCSIAPGWSLGQSAITGMGIKNLGADYHSSNYYPQAKDEPEMRYGPFTQLWTTTYGKGRVCAFTDSTIFANFSTFEEGKSELMLGMLEWLDHKNASPLIKPLLILIGILLLGVSIVLSKLQKEACLILLSAGLFSWSITGIYTNHFGMELPRVKRPMIQVALDRNISAAQLPTGGFISGLPDCFGQFERSIQRVGYFSFRPTFEHNFDGDMLIIIYPAKRPDKKFIEGMKTYVEKGGRVLVIDSPKNDASTSKELLAPFGLEISTGNELKGIIDPIPPFPAIEIFNAMKVEGGNIVATIDGHKVAATIDTKGGGSITFIGFGFRFSDNKMGFISDVEPDEKLRKVFDFEFILLRSIIESSPPFGGMDRLRKFQQAQWHGDFPGR